MSVLWSLSPGAGNAAGTAATSIEEDTRFVASVTLLSDHPWWKEADLDTVTAGTADAVVGVASGVKGGAVRMLGEAEPGGCAVLSPPPLPATTEGGTATGAGASAGAGAVRVRVTSFPCQLQLCGSSNSGSGSGSGSGGGGGDAEEGWGHCEQQLQALRALGEI